MRKWLAATAVVFSFTVAMGAVAQDLEAQREQLMKEMGGAVRTLSQMSKGQATYDAAAAAAAFTTIRDHAKAIPAAFASPPPAGTKTEASPKIWENMADFTTHAKALEDDASASIQVAANGVDALGPAVQKLGGDCGACHQLYRLKD